MEHRAVAAEYDSHIEALGQLGADSGSTLVVAEGSGVGHEGPHALLAQIGGQQQRGIHGLRIGVIAHNKTEHRASLSQLCYDCRLYPMVP